MGKSSAPKAPKQGKTSKAAIKATKAATKQAKKANKLQEQQMAFFQKAYDENKGTTDAIAAKQLEILDQNSEYAKADRERFATVFQPLEDNLAQEALDYSTEGRKDLERGRAQAAVAQEFEAARQSNIRELEGYGINPASTRYAALDLGVRTQQAAAEAAAANESDQRVENTRRALRQEAIGVGQKYPGYSDQASDTAITAGNSAGNLVLDQTKVAAATMGTPVDYGAQANTALGIQTQGAIGSGQLDNQAYANQLDAYKAEQDANVSWGEVGMAALGAGAKIASNYVSPTPKAAKGGPIPGAIPAPGRFGFGNGNGMAGWGGTANPGSQVPMSASPSGGQMTDDVNARLTPGEFVLPVDVVKWKGEEFFQKLIDQARSKKDGASAKPEMGSALPGPTTFDSGGR